MAQIEKHGPCSGPTNRSFLELGGASLCGLGLGALARATGSKRLLSEDNPAVGYLPQRETHEGIVRRSQRGESLNSVIEDQLLTAGGNGITTRNALRWRRSQVA